MTWQPIETCPDDTVVTMSIVTEDAGLLEEKGRKINGQFVSFDGIVFEPQPTHWQPVETAGRVNWQPMDTCPENKTVILADKFTVMNTPSRASLCSCWIQNIGQILQR